ncbi:MAG TPA: glycosyltransferase family 87 protein [Candidatus Dormibacteraeota bacterium]
MSLAKRVAAQTRPAIKVLRAIGSFGPAYRATALTGPVPRPQKLPRLSLAIAALIGTWCLTFELIRFVGLVRSDPSATDFRLFYLAAQAGQRWGWSHMYDPDKLQALSVAFGPAAGRIVPSYTYDNPPLLAFLIAPLTTMPLTAAFVLWTVINIAASVAAWWLASPGIGFARVTILLCTLALWPTVFSLERGQPVLVTYALAIGCWWMAARHREVEAGVLLALATVIKPQDVALLPVVLLIGGFPRAAAYWLAATAVLGALFAVVIGANGIGTYLAVLEWAASDPGFTATPLIQPFGPQASLVVGEGIVLAAAVVGMWRQRRSWNVIFAIGLLATLVCSIHIHEYDYVGVAIAAWLVLREPVSLAEKAWLAVGVLCAQGPAISIRIPIVLWQPIWLVMLTFRGIFTAGGRRREDSPALDAELHESRSVPGL